MKPNALNTLFTNWRSVLLAIIFSMVIGAIQVVSKGHLQASLALVLTGLCAWAHAKDRQHQARLRMASAKDEVVIHSEMDLMILSGRI
jgi:hypothetical protein